MLYAGSQPAGYAGEPVETVNYVGCHDREILFDQLIMKAAEEVSAPCAAPKDLGPSNLKCAFNELASPAHVQGPERIPDLGLGFVHVIARYSEQRCATENGHMVN